MSEKKARLEAPPQSADDMDVQMKARMRSDWPSLGSLPPSQLSATLYQHDLPHDESNLEWWYINGHFGEAKRFSLFAAFFRLKLPAGDEAGNSRAYALNWALADARTGKYHRFAHVQHNAPEIVTQMMANGEYAGDTHVQQAMRDLFALRKVPLPDQMLPPNSVTEAADVLSLQIGKSCLRRSSSSSSSVSPHPIYDLVLEGVTNEQVPGVPETAISIHLKIQPVAGAALHGRDGVVSVGSWHHDMFYYFSPVCQMLPAPAGEPPLVIDGEAVPVDQALGTFWIDHEFGGTYARNANEAQRLKFLESQGTQGLDHSWQWAALHLSNGDALSVTQLTDSNTQKVVEQFAIYQVRSTGIATRFDDVVLSPVQGTTWKSPATGMSFPTAWEVAVPALQLQLKLTAPIKEQEFISLGGKPSYWEGRVDFAGSMKGSPCTGLGFLECHVKQDTAAITKALDMMAMLMLMPLQMNPMIVVNPANPAAAPTAEHLAGTAAAPVVEQTAMMLAMAGEKPLTAEQKQLLRSFLGAFAVVTHRPGAEVPAALAYAEEAWLKAAATAPPDYRLVMLRAFMRRGLESAVASKCPDLLLVAQPAGAASPEEKTIAKAAVGESASPYRRPTEADFCTAAPEAMFDAFAARIGGPWAYDKPRNTDKISDFLAAQGVGLAARLMCGAVTPSLQIKAEALSIETTIITSISTTAMKVLVNGEKWTWNSFGRGNVTARACLLSESTVCVETTLPADQSVELKWLTANRGELAEYMEHHASRQSLTAGQPPIATFRQFFKRGD
jgi:predicted secreted hydrolase